MAHFRLLGSSDVMLVLFPHIHVLSFVFMSTVGVCMTLYERLVNVLWFMYLYGQNVSHCYKQTAFSGTPGLIDSPPVVQGCVLMLGDFAFIVNTNQTHRVNLHWFTHTLWPFSHMCTGTCNLRRGCTNVVLFAKVRCSMTLSVKLFLNFYILFSH